MANVSEILRTIFGFDDFRPGQQEIVDTVIGGKNVLAIMPTGGGKSLCYQLPALARTGVVLVVSFDRTDARSSARVASCRCGGRGVDVCQYQRRNPVCL